MPLTTENIFYADDNTPLSLEAISAAQATSIGDSVEAMLYQTGLAVSTDRERDDLFPNPKAGDTVWRKDFGIEQRYYEAYSQLNPGGREPAGWYATKGTMVPLSAINLDGKSSVAIPNIFNKTFTKYVLLVAGVRNVSSGALLQFISSSGIETNSIYSDCSIYSSSTSIVADVGLTAKFARLAHAASGDFISKTTITFPAQSLNTQTRVETGSHTIGTSSNTQQRYCRINNTKEYTGIYIYLTAGTFTSGNLTMYGIL